jgi:hypothetical protein
MLLHRDGHRLKFFVAPSMNLPKYCILVALSLAYAGLTLTEFNTYQNWEAAVNGQKLIQSKLANAKNLSGITDQFIRRLAVESQHDPDLADMLKKHDIKVVISSPKQTANDTPPPGSAINPAPANAPAPPAAQPPRPTPF